MHYPAIFYLTFAVLIGLCAELLRQRGRAWALPAFIVYVVVFMWYYLDLVLYGEKYEDMADLLLNYSYAEVLIFLIVFRLLVPHCSRLLTGPSAGSVSGAMNAETLLPTAIGLWAVLFVFAIGRMDWDVLNALFPLDGRAGDLMWLRAAAEDAGPAGFLISTGSYLYLVACSFFGILAVLLRRLPSKGVATFMIFLTWPFYLLSGTRNQFLAVSLPWAVAYFLFGRQKKVVRYVFLTVVFLCVSYGFLFVIQHRNGGYRNVLAGVEEDTDVEDPTTGHAGLNMIQELCYINSFEYLGQIELTWGNDYLTQMVSVVPRAIWQGKPKMGIEYAVLRGYGGAETDTGVVATISTGLIGQGVLEFGPIFGPFAPAVLMAFWCGLLARWWIQRAATLRLCLYLLGLGVTMNLGRDITSLTLWPVAFAYLLTRIAEKVLRSRPLPARTPAAIQTERPALPGRKISV